MMDSLCINKKNPHQFCFVKPLRIGFECLVAQTSTGPKTPEG